MIAAAESVCKGISRTSRVTVFLVLGTAISATLAVAEDRPESDPPSATSSSPPPQFTPMTRSERFSNYLGSVASYGSIIRAAAAAGIQQANGTPKEWGGGAAGYGDRVGDAYAYNVINRTLQYGISAALHEDNRYFVSDQTGFFRRTKYAIRSTLLARHDNGSQSISFSRFGGAAGAAFISRSWQPRSTTTAGDGAVSFGLTISADVGFNVFREFWPDLKRHLRKK